MPEADLILLDRYRRSGDEDAFAELVQRYAPMVYAAGLRVLGDKARAEDVAQETFFQLVKKPDAASTSLGGWLHRVATQRAIDVLRSETARRLREKFRGREVAERTKIDTWSDLSPSIDEALAALDEGERDLLVRHFLQGESQTDIAAQSDTSPATISRRMKRALESLRSQVERMGKTANLSIVVLALEHSYCGEVPATLAAELGKMSMVSGVSAGVSGGVAASSGIGLTLSTGAMVIAAGVVTVAGFVWFIADELSAPSPAATTISISESVSTDTGSASATASASVSTTTTPTARYITTDPGLSSLRSDHIASFQDPATSYDNTVQVVFGDGHVQRMTTDELSKRIKKQQGRSLEDLLKRPTHERKSAPTHTLPVPGANIHR